MDQLGKALATVTLVASSEKAPPTSCRLWLPLDALYKLRCEPGAIKLVAVMGSNGVPAPLIDRLDKKISVGIQFSDSVGAYCVLAELWPSQRLRLGTAAMSESLASALSCSASSGTALGIFDVPAVLDLRPCRSLKLKLYATPVTRLSPQAADVEPASPSPASPAQRGRAGMPTPRASPPSMRASAAAGEFSPNLLGPPKERNTKKKKSAGQRNNDASDASGEGSQASQKEKPSDELQLVAVEGLLAGELGAKFENVLCVLAGQALQDRFLLCGNLLTLPFLGSDIQIKVEAINESARIAGQVIASTSIEISREDPNASSADQAPSYAHLAARAVADAFGEDEESAAAKAAFEAAAAGERSLGSSLAELGGLEDQMTILRQSVTAPLRAYEKFAAHNLFPPSGVLFHGPPGTGKTAIARATATDANAAFFVINGPDIVSEYLGESESCLKGIFTAAKALAPSVIFIDEIDAIAPSRGGSAGLGNNQSPVSARLVTTLLSELDSLQGHATIVLAATNRLQALDESLRRPGRLDKEIEIGVPSPGDRFDILRKMLSRLQHSLQEDEIFILAEEAHGYVGADLSALCSEAAMSALRRIISNNARDGFCISSEDFAHAKGIVKPSALREIALETPKVKWDDIGGNDSIKQQLKEVVEWPRQFQSSLSRIGVAPPKGVLLYGPPGCSKTMLAKAVAREANMNFLAVKGPELFNKYVGESEKALRNVFEKARASSPSVLFFDEIDGMIGSRSDGPSSGGVHVGERVLSQLLQEMDGLQVNADLIIIAATNRPDCLDPALLRPGRFDRLLYLAPPDLDARKAIFKIHTRAMPLDANVDLEKLAQVTEGYSGADIAAICQQAALLALEENENIENIELRHLESAVERVIPSALDDSSIEMYTSFGRKVS